MPVQAAVRSIGAPSTLRMTSMFPRVALEYGQRSSARTMRCAGRPPAAQRGPDRPAERADGAAPALDPDGRRHW
jgi:hypothetical protein